MRIIEDRSFGYAELLLAVQANVQDTGRNFLRLHLAGLLVQPLARSGLLHVTRHALTAAMDALGTVGPAHLFEEMVAGFRGAEGSTYIYQVHFARPLYALCGQSQLLSSR